MSSEAVILRVAVATFIVAVISVIVTVVYGEIQRRLARRQLSLAQQQAAMRPQLEVSCEVERGTRAPVSAGTLRVKVSNSGRTAAHNVHGWVYFHESFFGPPKPPPAGYGPRLSSQARFPRWGAIFDHAEKPNKSGWYVAQIYENEEIVSSSYRAFEIPVTLRRAGKTPIRCRVVSNEGATFDKKLEVEVPSLHPA